MEETSMTAAPKKFPFNPKLGIIVGLVVLVIVGVFLFTRKSNTETSSPVKEQEQEVVVEKVDASISVDVAWSKSKDNTVVLTAKGLGGKYTSVGYELQYESGGVGKGVTSGSKPLDVTGKDTFDREIYLGTCSRNVCKPDPGVKKVSVVLEFTSADGKRSEFSKDYDL